MEDSATPKTRLLIVSGDDAGRDQLAQALGQDYELVCLLDGGDVVAQLDKSTPRLLILDTNRPGGQGFAISEAVRAQPRHENLPILFMKEADPAGAQPLALLQLRRCIQYLLSQELR